MKRRRKRTIREIKTHLIIFSFLLTLKLVSCFFHQISHPITCILRSKWFSPKTKSKLSAEWISDDSKIKSCKRSQSMGIFHLSRLRWKARHDGVMLLTHHLKGCYEFQKMIMFNMMTTTDPMFIADGSKLELSKFFFWQKSIKIFFVSLTICEKLFISPAKEFSQQHFECYIDHLPTLAPLVFRVSL